MLQFSPGPVADAFCASRLDGGVDAVFGALPSSVDTRAVLRRSAPWVE